MGLDPTLKAIAEYGLALVALALVTSFSVWLVRGWLDDLRKRADRGLDIAEGQVKATGDLAVATGKLADRYEAIEDRLAELERRLERVDRLLDRPRR